MTDEITTEHRRSRRLSWMVLSGLLVLLTLGALSLDRSTWPSLVGDEATYLVQAESLAWDADLRYSREDYQRFVDHHRRQPEGLILQSGDGGAVITFGKPFFYALFLAPFLRLAPAGGAFVANALLLALAGVLAARALERRVGGLASLWVSAFVFASVSFAYTFWVHADLFLMCLTAIALALAYGEDEEGPGSPPGWRIVGRWLAVGVLLSIVGFSRPMYLSLFLPALVAVPRRHRRLGIPALVAGGLILCLAAIAVHQTLAGSWTSYGAARRGFYSYTGFPDIDFPAGDWNAKLGDLGNHAWVKPAEVIEQKKVVASLWGWNTIYLLLGRHVGLLPYFLPLVLGFAGRPRGWRGWSLVVAVALAVGAFFLLRPFNFYGGGGAIGNRYFLPLYPALWFLPSRSLRGAWVVAAALAAGLFVGPLWFHPRDFPLMTRGGYRYVSPVAQRILPYETTQSHLKPAAREDVIHHGLWIKFLNREVWADEDGESLKLRRGPRGRGGELLVGSHQPLEALDLELRAPPGARLELRGGRLRTLREDGPLRKMRILLSGPRARHPMWWTWKPFHLYRLTLSLEGAGEKPVSLKLSVAEPGPGGPGQ
ncbi:MAG: hypothetical protein GY856_42385 [bacterium]|nr:hypothetical protein [bacterium]